MNELGKKNSDNVLTQELPGSKAAVGLTIFFFVLTLILGMITVFFESNAVSFLLLKTCQVSAFFLAGIVYQVLLNKYISTGNNPSKAWLYNLLVTIFVFIALLILYFYNNRFWPIIALGSSCAFFLPFIISQVWQFFRNISEDGEENIKLNFQAGAQDNVNLEIFEPDKFTEHVNKQEHYGRNRRNIIQNKFKHEPAENGLPNDQKNDNNGKEINLKLIREEAIKERGILENKFRLEQEAIRQAEKQAYEIQLKEQRITITQIEKDFFERRLKREQEKIIENEKEVYDAKLKNELEKLKEEDKIFYDKQLEEAIEKISEKEKEAYENQLKQNEKLIESENEKVRSQYIAIIRKDKEVYDANLKREKEELQREIEIVKNELKSEQELVIHKDKEATAKEIKPGQNEIFQREREAYETRLKQEQELAIQKYKKEYEEQIKMEQQEIFQQEKEVYENRLKEELEAKQVEIETFKNELKSEQELAIQKHKKEYDEQIKVEQQEIFQQEKEVYESRLKQKLEAKQVEIETYKVQLKSEQELAIQKHTK
ncbi:MAG: hypothetical protein M3015_15300, partial [Bacteroidota bacterium]|nr:hypothetical protein [Bacteroidota bacterium]